MVYFPFLQYKKIQVCGSPLFREVINYSVLLVL